MKIIKPDKLKFCEIKKLHYFNEALICSEDES